MVEYLKPLLDDDYFTIQPGVLPGRSRFSGADLGPGIIYYPSDLNLDFHLAGSAASIPVRQPLPAGLSALWNAGSETVIFNHEAEPSEFVRVALKPSASLMAEIPEQFIGPAYASLLQADWDQPFKESVRNDLDIIGAIVDPLLHRRYVHQLQFE